jgi:Arc/MetJ-type ribon-helix-helix transcriptional regulator
MIEVELPDGRVVEINTTDPAVAAQAAQKFLSSSAPKPDKYQQAAVDERDALKAKGVDRTAGITRRLAQGATLNFADEVLAGLSTPLEMAKRGTFNPIEGYKYAKASEDLSLDDSRKQGGVAGALGTGAEILGGVGTGLGAARAGLSFARGLASNAGLLPRSLASAGDAAAFGNLSGAGEGNSIGERMQNAAIGTGLGGLLGGAAPAALSLLRTAVSPITSNISALSNPTRYGNSQVARAVIDSGMTPQDIASSLRTAAAEGQGMFTAADAMGAPGRRMLATTVRGGGPASTDTVNFLDTRQAGQGRRVANALAEGFDSPQTGAQTEARLTAARDAAADTEYGAVRAGAGRTDVVPALNNLDRNIGTGPGQTLTPANDSIEAILTPYRQRLARVNPDDFEAVQRIRGDMADAADNAFRGGFGNRSRLIRQAVRELDTAMEAASSGYRQANQNFAQASGDIAAVQQGRQAATRGRTENTIPAFQALRPQGQQAFRSGYVDPLIENAQGAAFGVNKARPLTSDAFADEAAAMAPGNPLMQRRIGREDAMFQTRQRAVGNSNTAENLSDDRALGSLPTLVGQIISGNFGGATRTALGSLANGFSGNTPAVRQVVADALLTRGTNANAAQFERMIDETVRRIQYIQRLASSAGRGVAGGAAVGGWDANRSSTSTAARR